MSSRSTGTSIAAASAHRSPASNPQPDGRSSLGSALTDTTAAGAAASSAPTRGHSTARDTGSSAQGRPSSGAGDFQRLLTHVGTTAQASAQSAPADGKSSSKTQGHGRKSDSKPAPSSGATATTVPPGTVVVAPLPVVSTQSPSTPSVSKSSASASTGKANGVASSGSLGAGADARAAAALAQGKANPEPSAQSASTSDPKDAAKARDADSSAAANRGGDRSNPLDLQTLLAEALVHAPARNGSASPDARNGSVRDSASGAAAGVSSGPSAASSATGTVTVSGSIAIVSSSADGSTGSPPGSSGDGGSSGHGPAPADPRSALAHAIHGGSDLAAQMPSPASPVPTTKIDLAAPVGTAHWNDELGNQLIWMAHHNVDGASLHVSPAGLGPIEARIAVQGSTATVWFGASHPDTRAALEQALPQLREMFAMQGMALTDSGVFREAPRRRQPLATSAISSASSIQPLAQPSASPAPTAALPGLVDLYA
jgi:flagellar hook-length control protein FliK